MKHFNKILCPYDFSDYAKEALDYALKLADNDTVITLLNVVQLPYLIDPNGFTYYDVKADDLKKATEEAMEKKINALNAKYPNLKVDYKLVVGYDPAEAILTTQEENNYELIVIGSHGRRGLGRLLMGSVAESVLREATCPVLIIKTKPA